MVSELTTALVTAGWRITAAALAKSTMESAANSLKIVEALSGALAWRAPRTSAKRWRCIQQAPPAWRAYRTQVMRDKKCTRNLLAGDTVPDNLLPGAGEPER